MSWISSAVVVHGMEYRQRMEEVNNYLEKADPRGQYFCQGDDWSGGTKIMDTVWGAGFNYVSYDLVMEALQSTKWNNPEHVILLWKDEMDYNWNVYRLGDEEVEKNWRDYI